MQTAAVCGHDHHLQVPSNVTGEELLKQAQGTLPSRFPAACNLVLAGNYPNLNPDDVRAFLLSSPLAESSNIQGLALVNLQLPNLPLFMSTILHLPRRWVGVGVVRSQQAPCLSCLEYFRCRILSASGQVTCTRVR